MAPLTRRRVALMRWDELRLPNELVEAIAIETFSTCLDEHFNYASTLGGIKFPFSPEIMSSSEGKHRRLAEMRDLQKFFPVVRFCQICHQYRSMALRVLTSLFPTD